MRSNVVRVLLLLEMQQEYTLAGRPEAIEAIEPSLEACGQLLKTARRAGWIVAHVRRIGSGLLFNPSMNPGRFISGFEPQASEPVFDNPGASGAFGAPGFHEFSCAVKAEGTAILVAGYSGERAILATLMGLSDRAVPAVYLPRASASRAMGIRSEGEVHEAVTDLATSFASIGDPDHVSVPPLAGPIGIFSTLAEMRP